jgi:hypothetical protein
LAIWQLCPTDIASANKKCTSIANLYLKINQDCQTAFVETSRPPSRPFNAFYDVFTTYLNLNVMVKQVREENGDRW